MRINSIINTPVQNRNLMNKKDNRQIIIPEYNTKITDIINSYYTIPFLGSPRVDKRLPRFENFNDQQNRLTTTLKKYLETINDKLSITPPEAMKNAYADLNTAKTVEDVKRLFPDEELFIYLTSLKDTVSKRGILGIYKEFEEIFQNGILKNGEDFTVYLLRKLFVETKVYKDINSDLDNDLIPDIKEYFTSKYGHNEYITTEVLRGLEIYPPDQDMRNSLKFTKDGYSDLFGLTISAALLSRLKNMSEEEKNEEINNRSEGLEEWWNSMSYDEKLELVAGVDSEEEVYKNYRKFANENRRSNRRFLNGLLEFIDLKQKKKVKTSIKLNDKDVYVLWMQRNLAKYYDNLTEEEKSIIDIKRSKRQVQRWQEMTPEERTEYINRIRSGIEPLRYIMIDAWNHSRLLIRALSEFLKEHQVMKPVDMLYSSEEFSEFQSRIMTEFWAQNKDFAKDFGIQIKYAHNRVEEAIKNGQFEKLKKEIEAERDERKRILAEEYQAEADRAKKIEEEKIKEKEESIPQTDKEYRKEFSDVYKKAIDKYNILPLSYKNEMAEIFLERFPKDIVIKYTESLKANEPMPDDVMNYFKQEQDKNLTPPRAERLQRSLEAAIAAEMVAKGANPVLFELDINTLITLAEKRYSDITVPKQHRIDPGKIARLFKEFDRDLDGKELNTLANTYFASKSNYDLTREQNDKFEDYLNSYGRSLYILFSDKSAYSNEVKYSFNNKFIKLMPSEIKEFIHMFIQTPEDIQEENEIRSIVSNIYKRFKYLPDEILKIYTKEIGTSIRIDRETHENNTLQTLKETFSTKSANERPQAFPGFIKPLLQTNDKLKLIAMEEAMADEFYRVTKNEDVYSRDFAQLLNFFDMTSIMGPQQKSMTLHNESGEIIYHIKEKPNTKNLYLRYIKYINAIQSNEDIETKDGQINIEELLYALNPLEDNTERDKNIMSRINSYFEEMQPQKESKIQSQTPIQAETTEETTKKTNPEENIKLNNNNYKIEFRTEFFRINNPNNILPMNYVKEIAEIILETLPREAIEEYTLKPNVQSILSDKNFQTKCTTENKHKLALLQHSLETAIATELVEKGGDVKLFGETAESLIAELKKQEVSSWGKKQNKIDTDRIQALYNEYRKELTQTELTDIINGYFVYSSKTKHPTQEDDKILIDYIKEYGRSALILFSQDTTISLDKKAAFNEKFLRLMPQEVKNITRPLIKTKDDLKDNLEIEMIRRKIAKRFDFIPKAAINTYTFEAATFMRLSRLPDFPEEMKNNYSIKNFKESLANKKTDSNELSSVLRIPKNFIYLNSSKLKLLALEQAMADELYRVSKNNIVYKYEFEDLALWFELSSDLRKDNKDGLAISNENNEDTFIIKEKPNPKNIIQKYIRYVKELEKDDDIYLENGELDREEILYCLNPNENLPERDKYTKERIDAYFAD